MVDIIKISPSSMEVMSQCHRKWYYRYIEKNYPKVPKDPSADFGSLIHLVAEKFESSGSLEDIKNILKEGMVKYPILGDYRAKLIPAVKNLYTYYKQRFAKGAILKERAFETLYKEKFYLKGSIDAFYIDETNKVFIIDYKTNKASKDHLNQLSFYVYVAQLLFDVNVPSLTCEIVYLAQEPDYVLKTEEYIITKVEVERIIKKINLNIQTYKNLGESKEKWPMNPSGLCPYCDYKKAGICEPDLS